MRLLCMMDFILPDSNTDVGYSGNAQAVIQNSCKDSHICNFFNYEYAISSSWTAVKMNDLVSDWQIVVYI